MSKKLVKKYLALITIITFALCMVPYQIQPDVTLSELPVVKASTISGSAININR